MMSFERPKAIEVKDMLGDKCRLRECTCFEATSSASSSVRDKVDQHILAMFEGRDKHQPIFIVDIIAGGLLQTATIVKTLADDGYRVNISLIGVDSGIPENFKQWIARLNERKADSVVLGGIFSTMDSYLCAIEGSGPLAFQRVASTAEREARVRKKEGKKPGDRYRYLLSVLDQDIFDQLYKDKNRGYQSEFDEAKTLHGKTPDLVLCIDDITEYASALVRVKAGIGGRDEFVAEGVQRDYFFRQDVIEPLALFAPNACIVATHKEDAQIRYVMESASLLASGAHIMAMHKKDARIHLLHYPKPNQAPTYVETMYLGKRVQEIKQSASPVSKPSVGHSTHSIAKELAACASPLALLGPAITSPKEVKGVDPTVLVQEFIMLALKEGAKEPRDERYFSHLDMALLQTKLDGHALSDIKKCASYLSALKFSSSEAHAFHGWVKSKLIEAKDAERIRKVVENIEAEVQKLPTFFGWAERAKDIRGCLEQLRKPATTINESYEILLALKIAIGLSKDFGMKDQMAQITQYIDGFTSEYEALQSQRSSSFPPKR